MFRTLFAAAVTLGDTPGATAWNHRARGPARGLGVAVDDTRAGS